ncbi:sugar phosphate isomerase/epimerase family protein [Alteromonas lipotrueiana]|uniref:sugar phosphate isomerase/epimerase family protein n=1 Tax=Alteromonas lipotrueiana TaxID=2803815 RepID=UPI001C46F544|nr:sugar phosphate isomerase/epimerase [Alteromonas lipotrueiana]
MPAPSFFELNKSAINRRRFLKLSATAASIATLPLSLSLMAREQQTQAVTGLQLYTLRDWMAVSVPATLKMAAAVGYKELEFAGYFNHKPAQIKQMLNDEGLQAPSVHTPLTAFENSVEKVIESALEVGHRYVVLPYLTEAQRGSHIDVYKKLADNLNVWGEACNRAGLTLAYHNHAFEFIKTNNQLPYDVLLNRTQPELLSMEMDLFWMAKAGQDPLVYFAQHPGRFKLWHVKDMDKAGEFADVGTGVINFAPIFAQAQKAGVEHYFIERDQTEDKLATLKQGHQALSALL